jgi:hypothetical protein
MESEHIASVVINMEGPDVTDAQIAEHMEYAQEVRRGLLEITDHCPSADVIVRAVVATDTALRKAIGDLPDCLINEIITELVSNYLVSLIQKAGAEA